jgi:hypothetical protein
MTECVPGNCIVRTARDSKLQLSGGFRPSMLRCQRLTEMEFPIGKARLDPQRFTDKHFGIGRHVALQRKHAQAVNGIGMQRMPRGNLCVAKLRRRVISGPVRLQRHLKTAFRIDICIKWTTHGG